MMKPADYCCASDDVLWVASQEPSPLQLSMDGKDLTVVGGREMPEFLALDARLCSSSLSAIKFLCGPTRPGPGTMPQALLPRVIVTRAWS